MIDDKTTNLELPLPHQSNNLEDDVLRLREALTGIDNILASDDPELSTLQQLVDGIHDLRTQIDDLKIPVEETITLTDGQTVINLAVLTGTAGATVFVEGVRLAASKWTPHATIATRLTLNSNYPAGHEVTVTRRQKAA